MKAYRLKIFVQCYHFTLQAILGKAVDRPAILDQELAKEIIQLREQSDNYEVIGRKTMSTDDFYEGM